MKYSCIYMANFTNSLLKLLSLESKIQHKHQQCDEMLPTFMKIYKLMNVGNKSNSVRARFNSSTPSTLSESIRVPADDDTYQSLSDDILIMSSSDNNEMACIKRKSTNCSTRKESNGRASL